MEDTIFNSIDTNSDGKISKDEWRVWQEEKSKLLRTHNDEKINLINEITDLRVSIIQAKKLNYKSENNILLQKSFEYVQSENNEKNAEIIELSKLIKSKDELYNQLENKNHELENKIFNLEEVIKNVNNDIYNKNKLSIIENVNDENIKIEQGTVVENTSNVKDNEVKIVYKHSAYENKILEVINNNNNSQKSRVKELEIENNGYITMLKDAEEALLNMENQVRDITQEKESIEQILLQLVNSTEEMKKEYESKNNQFEQEKILAEKNYRRIRKKYQDSNDIIAGLKSKLESDDSLPSWVNVISKQLYDINDNELSPLKSSINKPNKDVNKDINNNNNNNNNEIPIKIVDNIVNVMKNDKIESDGSYLKSMGLINGINKANIYGNSNNNNNPPNDKTFKSSEHMLRQAFRNPSNRSTPNIKSSSVNNSFNSSSFSLSPKKNNINLLNESIEKQPNFLTHTGSSSNYVKEVIKETKPPLNIAKAFKFQ